LTFQPDSILFDKSVIRRVYEHRVRLAVGQPPTLLQAEAANAYARLCTFPNKLYITEQTANILQRRPIVFASAFLTDTQTLKKGRYLRRWARRLRELSFSPEDAIIVAYGSFGVDLTMPAVGVEIIVTGDLKLAAHFSAKQEEIRGRFESMISSLSEPYQKLMLPSIATPTDILTLM
jgi:hypothetical protein